MRENPTYADANERARVRGGGSYFDGTTGYLQTSTSLWMTGLLSLDAPVLVKFRDNDRNPKKPMGIFGEIERSGSEIT